MQKKAFTGNYYISFKFKLFVIFTMIFWGMALLSSAYAQPQATIRLTNTINADGTITKTMSISSSHRDFFSEINPLLPRDPIWQAGEIVERDNGYFMEATALVDGTSSAYQCLHWEKLQMDVSKSGLFNDMSINSELKLEKPSAETQGIISPLLTLLKPTVMNLAKENNLDTAIVELIYDMAPELLKNVQAQEQLTNLVRVLGNTIIHYEIITPAPGFLVKNKDSYEPKAQASVKALDLIKGSQVTAKTRFLSLGIKHIFYMISFFIFCLLIFVVYIVSKDDTAKKRN